MLGVPDCLLDSASDLLQATGAAESFLDHKRSGVFVCTGEFLTAVGDDGVCSFGPSVPSFDSDSLLHSFLEDEAAEIRPLHPVSLLESNGVLSPPWCREFPKRLDEAAWMTSDFSPGRTLNVSGPSTSGGMGRPRERLSTAGRSSAVQDLPLLDVSTGSDYHMTSPSQRTTVAESSIQTSTHSEVDGHGFLILEGSIERFPPFVHYDPPSDRTTVRRQAKWRVMLDNAEENWGDICHLHAKLMKKRVRKGIPRDWRYRVWPLLSGGRMLQQGNPNLYSRLIRGHSEWEEKITTDLHRTLPRHIFFAEQDGPGQRSLFNCLKAYAIYDPEVGYVQGMGSFVAILLLVMSEEDAFWTFTALMREEAPFPRPSTAGPHVGCRRLFLQDLPLTHELQSKLMYLLQEKMPQMQLWLEQNDLARGDFATKWWMTLFCFVLPFQHVLRVWDVFLLEGWKMALRIGLAIMKCMESKLMHPEIDEHLLTILEPSNIARTLPLPDAFIKMALSIRISKSLQNWQVTDT